MQAGRAPVIKTDRKDGTMAGYTPLQQKAYEYLLNLIRTGGLEPGVIYSETKLAGEIGISRTPFKDALVRLSQEMDFVSRYMELQRLRFGGGVELELNIADEAMNRSVVPCSVQLLVENALKHNAVRPDNPLKIEIRTTRNSVMVSNEKRPRLTPPRSAGMGQRYLRQRYKDIAGKSIVIRETEDKYIVILPLL